MTDSKMQSQLLLMAISMMIDFGFKWLTAAQQKAKNMTPAELLQFIQDLKDGDAAVDQEIKDLMA
jgi:hypothetical protein